ncbi:MAG: ATP-binding cassette domain-containing protein, partial [Lutibacter sp.]
MIEFKNLHKRFGKLVVLDGLDLEISKGGIFAILGPNGSGKTTLIKCLLGMVIPNKG